MTISLKITPDCRIEEVSQQQERRLKRHRVWDGCALIVPEKWEFKQYRLTLTFPDLYESKDKFNPLATLIYKQLKSPLRTPEDVICGTAFISNESDDEIVDFTAEDLKYVLDKFTKL